MGTLGGALEARDIDASEGRLTAEVRGEIEKEDGVLVIKRIHVKYLLRGEDLNPEVVERVHTMHKEHCPVYRSLYGAIDFETNYEIVRG